MLVFVAFIALCVVCLIFLYSHVRYYYALRVSVKDVSGPSTIPLIGDLEFIRHRYDVITYMEKQSKKFPIFKTWLGPKLVVVLSDVNLIKKIFAAPQLHHRPNIMGVMGMPNGLVECGNAMWRIHRKIINPSFNPKILQNFLPIFSVKGKEMVESLTPHLDGLEFDLLDEAMKCAVLSILDTTFGADEFSEENKKIGLANMQLIINSVDKRMFDPLLQSDFVYQLTTQGRRETAARHESYAILDPVIDNRRALHSKTADPEAIYKPQIFIDQLLSPDTKFTDAEIKDECYTMVVSGSETSSLSVCYAILMLAMHPEIQDKVAAEIADFFLFNETVTADNINQIEYLDMVMKEALRLFPTVPIAVREPHEDFNLGPCTLKPGTTVLINLFRLHRDKKIWGEDAEVFKPERFAPENKVNLNPDAFLPFSAGQRNCIGQRYAIMSVKVMLISLLKAYKFSTNLKFEELKLTFTISLRLLNKHLVTIEAR